MGDSSAKIWIVYCWRGIEDDDINYIMRIWQLAKEFEDHGSRARLKRMTFDSGKRLWDHIIAKISELKIRSELNDLDSFIFVVSHNILAGEAFIEERSYALDCTHEYPGRFLRLISLVHV